MGSHAYIHPVRLQPALTLFDVPHADRVALSSGDIRQLSPVESGFTLTGKARAIMNAGDLAKMYEVSYGAINRNLEDVSQQESLVRPPAGNCLNWVLGHIVLYRGFMLKMIGRRSVLEGEHAIPYQRGSHPDGSEHYLDGGHAARVVIDAHQQLIPALSVMTDQELAENVPEEFNRPPLAGSIGNALARLSFHESYHAGQIGLLRRIAGKEGAIR